MMLPKFLLPVLVIAVSSINQVGGSFLDLVRVGGDQHHRSLDATDDCIAATIDLIDPLQNVSGLWFFPNYLALNFGVCNLTTAICDYNGTDYEEQSLADCNAVGGKIVRKDVRICMNDVAKVSNAPAFADLDFINVDFCFDQSCDAENTPMVQLHRALYYKEEREKTPGSENKYETLRASSLGLCLDPETAAPVPTPAPTAPTSGSFSLKVSSWIGGVVMASVVICNWILG